MHAFQEQYDWCDAQVASASTSELEKEGTNGRKRGRKLSCTLYRYICELKTRCLRIVFGVHFNFISITDESQELNVSGLKWRSPAGTNGYSKRLQITTILENFLTNEAQMYHPVLSFCLSKDISDRHEVHSTKEWTTTAASDQKNRQNRLPLHLLAHRNQTYQLTWCDLLSICWPFVWWGVKMARLKMVSGQKRKDASNEDTCCSSSLWLEIMPQYGVTSFNVV